MLKVSCPKGLQSQADYSAGYVDSVIYDYSLLTIIIVSYAKMDCQQFFAAF
jgi:hypothetical protein